MEEQIVITGRARVRKDLTTRRGHGDHRENSASAGDHRRVPQTCREGNAPNFQLNNGGATYSADGSTRINLRASASPAPWCRSTAGGWFLPESSFRGGGPELHPAAAVGGSRS